MKVSLLGIDDAGFKKQLRARTGDVTEGRAAKGSDIVFVKMIEAKEATRLEALRAAIKPGGAVWVVWPKGQKAFREDDARNAGPAAGLVDVKVASFSDTLSALKMVIPVKDRGVLR
jgi:tRNA A58 N-methylase Trm61